MQALLFSKLRSYSIQAWSAIVCHLVPNVASMEARLKQFAVILDADEVGSLIFIPMCSILFKKRKL